MNKYSVNVNYIAEDLTTGGVAGSLTVEVEAQDSFNAKAIAYSKVVEYLHNIGYKDYNITVSDVLMIRPEATAIMKGKNMDTNKSSSEVRHKSVTVHYVCKYTVSVTSDEFRDITIEGDHLVMPTIYQKGITDAEATSKTIKMIQDLLSNTANLVALDILQTEIKDRSQI